MYLVNAREMQQMDRRTIEEIGLPGRILMENAGRGATRFFLKHLYGKDAGKHVAVVAGRGNNGGDGFVMARYLSQKQIPVTVYLLSESGRLQGDAKANLELLHSLAVPVEEIKDEKIFQAQKNKWHKHDLFIDAILGTGLNSDVRGFYKKVITELNLMQKPLFAVDIPSGLDSDTGQIRGISIRADATATFGFAKIGHILHPGADYCGDLAVIEIGIPSAIASSVGCRQRLINSETIKRDYSPRRADAHKGASGHLLVLAGSVGKTGAAAMTSESALRIGAGLVTLGIPQSLNAILENRLLEVMTHPLPERPPGQLAQEAGSKIKKLLKDKRCLAIGPGLGTGAETSALVRDVIAGSDLPVIIDADGLNNLVGRLDILKERQAPTLITPHPGEMARLMSVPVSSIQRDRVSAARSLATEYGIHVVLKGAKTVIAHPDENVFINPSGNSGMASGGMGDVLTGLIAGLITQGYEVGYAAHAGVFLHGSAADHLANQKGPIGYLASEVMDQIPAALRHLLHDQHQKYLDLDQLSYPTP
jgi:NAD(P)H-hydrate epimerase